MYAPHLVLPHARSTASRANQSAVSPHANPIDKNILSFLKKVKTKFLLLLTNSVILYIILSPHFITTSHTHIYVHAECDMPGAVCQDPRFIGGDGLTFYFHGKKDRDFCLVTDPNLHINAHFIGKQNHNMKRDFTWVQSIAILFGNHHLLIAAQKTAAWDDSIDRLSLSFDGEPIPTFTVWKSGTATIERDSDTNSVVVEVDGLFKISAKVVPITQQESRIHNYGITEDDCFAHLELGFKFSSLNANVNGVLGQTYRENYVSRVKMGVAMPVLGGEREFSVSNIFATDCAVSQFRGGELRQEYEEDVLELPTMKCGTGIDGRGVVCKR